VGLAFAVGLVAVPASRTGAGGVAGVHLNNRKARLGSLVFDLGSEVGKGPVAQQPAHLAVQAGGSLPDTFEVFDGECLLPRERSPNECLGDAVVRVTDEAGLALLVFFRCRFADFVPFF
jgi:hypothetical protein